MPSLIDTVREAIAGRRLIAMHYPGHDRLVEPHILGVTVAGHEALSGYQVAGTAGSHLRGWKNFVLDEVGELAVTEATFARARSDYNPDDPSFALVLARL
jgi:hypothetical protein